MINAKPKHLLLNEGHTSNGAAGTALILVCFGGFGVLWWVGRREKSVSAHFCCFAAFLLDDSGFGFGGKDQD